MEATALAVVLLLPIGLGLVSAAVPLAFAFILSRSGRPATWVLALVWLVGILAAEFELVRVLLAIYYRGRCIVWPANWASVKFPSDRPCSISEWQMEQAFPTPASRANLIWGFRVAAALAHSVFFAVLTVLWFRRTGSRG